MAHRDINGNVADCKINITTIQNAHHTIHMDTEANQPGSAENGSGAAGTPTEGEIDKTEALSSNIK